jgi:hypothetical protein
MYLVKRPNGSFMPAYPLDAEKAKRFVTGEIVQAKVTKPRNPKFHRKFFALLNVGFDYWTPEAEYKGRVVEKNMDRFREEVTILAGYYDVVASLGGSVRLKAKSIAFANMEEDEFERLYSAVINVILQKVLTTWTREDLDDVVDQVLRFAA